MSEPKIYIGTSGWMYKHWNKFFYPEGLKGKKQLPYFAKFFNTVEINNTFYRVPRSSAAARWHDETPDDFVFAVKLNQYLTHRNRLILDEKFQERLDWFFESIKPLGKKAKILLIQLPPNFKVNIERLDEFLSVISGKLPKGMQVVCEFRHDSWFTEELYKILQKHKAGLVVAVFPGRFLNNYPITSSDVYLRYHATAESPDYSEKELEKWARYIKALPPKVKNVYVYFNNDFEGWAITNANYLKKRLSLF